MNKKNGNSEAVIENNFTPVTAQALIDPNLKLRLALGRWTPESSALGGSSAVDLFYDPQLRPDRMTMPLPDEDRRLLEILGPVARDWTVFESRESRKLIEIWVDIRDGDDEVRITFDPPTPSVARVLEAIARSGIPGLSERPDVTLLYMLRSIPLMPTWVDGYARPWGKHAVSIWTHPTIVRELTGEDPDREQLSTKTGLIRVAGRSTR